LNFQFLGLESSALPN